MPVVPRRGLGTRGVLHDPSPYDLPPEAFSDGSNVLFDGNSAKRAPIFRTLTSSVGGIKPFGLAGRKSPGGYDTLYVLGDTGKITSVISGTATDVTAAAWASVASPDQWTTTYLGDVTYVNRPTHVPWGMAASLSQFTPMPSWNSTWRCRALRAYKSALIAVNVTKGATAYPQMVKTSDLALAGLFPGSWDHTDPATNATENILADLTTPLVDGAVLSDMFVLYSEDQVWAMQAVPGSEVYQYRKLFADGGLIAPNCVVEADGNHYVFGTNDIYRHGGSGVDKQSIVEGLNRSFIFNEIDLAKSSRCFVVHAPRLRMILFCYPTLAGRAPFAATNGCNKAFVFNYAANTHQFVDLPDVTGAALVNVDSVPLWSTSTASWDGMGGTWASISGSYKAHIVFSTAAGGSAAITNRLVGYDFKDVGSLGLPYDPDYNTPAWLERVGLDMDETGAPLRVFKTFHTFMPQISMVSPSPLHVRIGSSLAPGAPVVWDASRTFNVGTSYKVNSRRSGRYLALRMTADDGVTPVPAAQAADWSWNAFDMDISDGGHR